MLVSFKNCQRKGIIRDFAGCRSGGLELRRIQRKKQNATEGHGKIYLRAIKIPCFPWLHLLFNAGFAGIAAGTAALPVQPRI